MRDLLIVLWLLLCSITSATAQVSIGIGFPGVSIGINLPVYPQLVPVPGYPVYYAPQLNSNYFFYDGMYWVYQQRQLVRELLVQRAMGARGPGSGAAVHPARSRALLPASLLRTSAGGVRMRRHVGVNTGAIPGSNVAADGIAGIAAPYHRQPRCPSTNGNIQGIAIRASSSSRRFKASITVTSRRTP